jgi:hypothetical protein
MIFESWDLSPGASQSDLSDVDTLKDICGCLITVNSFDISFAHFTVKEFVYSSRLWYNPDHAIRYFSLSETIVRQTFLSTVLGGAMAYIGPISEICDTDSDLYDHTLFYGFIALKNWQLTDKAKTQLRSIALEFLNPERPHFERLRIVLLEVTHNWEQKVEETRDRVRTWDNLEVICI